MRTKRIIVTFQMVLLTGLSAGCFSTESPASQLTEPAGAAAARCITPEESERMADQVLQLLNLERAERNLAPVTVDDKLAAIAEKYACRMVSENFFGHRDPINGHGPAERAVAGKYTYYAIGENLAAGHATAADVMKAWMDSESHRAIILDPTWRHVGIAVRSGGEYSTYWVQEFGDPADF